MRILAIEPYYGGSHKSFLDGWIKHSRHDWHVLSMPARKWKWRMRGSAITFAQEVASLAEQGQEWDLIFCSDMLNVAEFLGILGQTTHRTPLVVYFHENQITYPYQIESERDYQFGMSNITTALAADQVWFNSEFHQDEFLRGAKKILRKMPDFRCLDSIDRIKEKAFTYHPATELNLPLKQKEDIEQASTIENETLKIVWAARWEHDKNPEDFFAAIDNLKTAGVDFQVSVLGESFRDSPDCFERSAGQFKDHIYKWGFQPSFADYCSALAWADVFVSTAIHEFFGLSAIEAALAGAFPLLPNRLAYPEVFGISDNNIKRDHFYNGTVEGLTKKLIALSKRKQKNNLWRGTSSIIMEKIQGYTWPIAVKELDDAIEQV